MPVYTILPIMNRTYTSLIDAHITEKSKSEKVREPHVFWPSEASILTSEGVVGKCHRASFYNYTGIPPTDPIPAGSIRKMEAGRSIELNEHRFAEQAGILVDHNVKKRKSYDPVTISAEIDAIYKRPDDTKSIIEIKSTGGYFSISSVFGTKTKPGYPKLEHLLQTTLYIDMFEIPEVVLRYIDRESCDVKEHTVTLTPMKIDVAQSSITTVNGSPNLDFSLERIIQRYKVLDHYISNKVMPARDFRPNYSKEEKEKKAAAKKTKSSKPAPSRDWQCSYCRWLERCLIDE